MGEFSVLIMPLAKEPKWFDIQNQSLYNGLKCNEM